MCSCTCDMHIAAEPFGVFCYSQNPAVWQHMELHSDCPLHSATLQNMHLVAPSNRRPALRTMSPLPHETRTLKQDAFT